MNKFEQSLILYIEASFPIIYVDTFENEKVTGTIRNLLPTRAFLEWNVRGLFDFDSGAVLQGQSLEDSLEFFLQDPETLENRIVLLNGSQFFIKEPAVIERLKIIAQKIRNGEIPNCTIVIIAANLKLPLELEPYATILTLDFLSYKEIRVLIYDFLDSCGATKPNEDFVEELAVLFKGMSEFDINNVLSLAISSDGELNRSNLSLILEHKKQIIRKSGILDMVQVLESIDDIGGLENLKAWLQCKSKVFKNITKATVFGVDLPKGVLIVGMPGCGKSLSAKATAKLFDVPLLRLDMGRLMGKYVGESEANLRRAIALADACSPCVLWIDELEKAFAGISGQGGNEVTIRLFGYFLTWLQEKESMTFVIATANNIAVLPPELLRKGRFDEIFYVNLPNKNEREKIFDIHISKRRKQDLNSIDLKKLVDNTEGFSGADIENVIKDAVENAFVTDKQKITTEDVLSSITQANSLADTLKDSIDKLAQFYKEHKFKSAST